MRVINNGQQGYDSLRVSLIDAGITPGNWQPEYLVHINPSSIQIIPHCINCDWDTTLMSISANSLCGPTIERFQLGLKHFKSGDSLTVRFTSMRCCAENDSLLLNRAKRLNHWTLRAVTKTVCEIRDSIAQSLTGESFSSNTNINLDYTFTPVLSDLTAPSGMFGSPGPLLFINFNGLFSNPMAASTIGCTNLTGFCNTMNGWLRARLRMQTGLVMDSALQSQVRIVRFNGAQTIVWNPVYWYSETPPNTCDTGIYYFYFRIDSTIEPQFFTEGRFEFRFLPCCINTPGKSDYQIDFHLMNNPGGICNAISFPSLGSNQPPSNCSNCCWLPLARAANNVSVHCPGCLAPGIIANSYTMQRRSFGMPDANNNRKADTTAMLTSGDTAYFNTYSQQMHSIRANHRDVLEDRLRAHLQEGDPSLGGYDYPMMLGDTARLNVLQLIRNIKLKNYPQFKLTPYYLKLYIDAPDTSAQAVDCIDCHSFGISGLYRTQRIIEVDEDSIGYYFRDSAATNTYLFTFDDTDTSRNLHQNIVYESQAWPFTGFFEMQQYRLSVRYSVCDYFSPVQLEGSQPLEQRFKEAEIDNLMFMSGREQFANAFQMIPPKPDLLVNVPQPFTQAWADSFLFICEAFGGRFYFYSDEATNYSNYAAQTGNPCRKLIRQTALLRTAGLMQADRYPFEYKPPAFRPVQFKALIPPGYTPVMPPRIRAVYSTAANVFPPVATQWMNINLSQVTITDSVIIDLDTLPMLRCLIDSVNDNNPGQNLYIGDFNAQIEVETEIRPDACLPGTIYNPVHENFYITFTQADYNWWHHPAVLCIDTTIEQKNQGLLLSLQLPNPQMSFLLQPPQLNNASANPFCWNFNLTVTGQAAPYVFVHPYDTGQGYLTNYYIILNNQTFFPDSNGVIPIDTLLPAGTYTGQFCAVMTHCSPNAGETLGLHAGWNCNRFPDPVNAPDVCFVIDTLHYSYTTIGVNGQPAYSVPDSFALCRPFPYIFTLNSSAGGITPLSVVLSGIDPAVNVLSVTVANCDSSQTIQLTPPSYNFDSAAWAVTGPLDTGSCMHIIVMLEAGCGSPDSVTVPHLQLNAQSYCGDPLSFALRLMQQQQQIYFNGESDCINCFSISKLASTDTIATGDTMSFYIVICGSNSAADTLVLLENLPSNFILTGSIPSTVIVPAQGCDTVTVTGYFTYPGACMNNINTAMIITSSNDTLSADTCVTVVEPCLLAADTVIADSTFSNVYGQLLSNISIYIAGRFYINDNLTLQNCAVTVAPGGQIIVLQDLLELDSTVIEGCGFMWRGTHLVSGSANILVRNSSRISDAEYCIYAEDETTFKLFDSYITECVSGVYTKENYGNYNNIDGYTEGCRFGMINNSTFKPDYAGQTYHGLKPRAGMELNNVKAMTVGNNSANKNEFTAMNTGITGRGSIYRVMNSEFSHIQKDTAYKKDYDGTAVISVSDVNDAHAELRFYPLTAGGTTVDSCHRGVYTLYSNAIVNGVMMTDMVTGVYSTKCSNLQTTVVTGCTINASSRGIHWEANEGTGGMTATNNEINVSGSKSMGILMEETSSALSAPYLASCNRVVQNNGYGSIVTNNLYRPEISQNTVEIAGTAGLSLFGIALNGCADALVSDNFVSGHTATDTMKIGYYTSISTGSQLTCNGADSTGWGFYFGGISPGIFRGNTMGDHYIGLRLNKTAVIDTQYHAGNRWIGSYGSNYGAVNMNADSSQALASSLFIVDLNLGSTYFPNTPLSNPNNTGWFYDTLGNYYSCNTPVSCNAWREEDDKGSEELKMRIVEDEVLTSDYIPESKTIAKEYLYHKLKLDNSLLNSNNLFQSFAAGHDSTAIGRLFSISSLLNAISKWDSTSKDYLNSLNVSMQLLIDSLYTLDSLQLADANANYQTAREWLLLWLDFNHELKKILIQEHDSLNLLLINQLSEMNITVESDEIPLINEKVVNEAYIEYYENGKDALNFNLEVLTGIASQCPYKGGKAVYRARVLLNLLNQEAASGYYDFQICASEGIYRSLIPKQYLQKQIKLIPNPAIDYIDILFEGESTESFILRIENILGAMVMESVLDCKKKNNRILIDHLKPAVYFIKISDSNGFNFNSKLILLK